MIAAFLASYFLFGIFHSQKTNDVVAPDTPPGEYLYLDRARVHSYLSQIVDGLADSEKRTLANTEDLSAEIKAGAAGLGGKRSQSSSSESQIKPTPADRFYLLLRLLRQGESRESGSSRPWLYELQGAPTEGAKNYDVYDGACQVREGDFVRIHNAHLSLSPYAALLPKARYATLNRRTVTILKRAAGKKSVERVAVTKSIAVPDQKLFAPNTRAKRRAILRYQHLLGRDPRLPFVVRTPLSLPRDGPKAQVTFFIPAPYSSLRNEPSLISGTLTIVGKVVYLNLTRTASNGMKKVRLNGKRIGCNARVKVPSTVPRTYVDRQTAATFLPALNIREAPAFVWNNLRFNQESTAKDVTANMTILPPVMVVVPIAMYQ